MSIEDLEDAIRMSERNMDKFEEAIIKRQSILGGILHGAVKARETGQSIIGRMRDVSREGATTIASHGMGVHKVLSKEAHMILAKARAKSMEEDEVIDGLYHSPGNTLFYISDICGSHLKLATVSDLIKECENQTVSTLKGKQVERSTIESKEADEIDLGNGSSACGTTISQPTSLESQTTTITKESTQSKPSVPEAKVGVKDERNGELLALKGMPFKSSIKDSPSVKQRKSKDSETFEYLMNLRGEALLEIISLFCYSKHSSDLVYVKNGHLYSEFYQIEIRSYDDIIKLVIEETKSVHSTNCFRDGAKGSSCYNLFLGHLKESFLIK